MVKLHPIVRHRGLHKGLVQRYEGPFRVVKRVGKVAYKLDMPPKLRVHPVFHVSMLKPFHEDEGDPGRTESKRAPLGARASYEKEVHRIIADRKVRRKNYQRRQEYMVRWKGLPDSEASWEPADDLW